ncbi:hypothetical protein Tcan_04259 [Toxocara canis]|uniref:Uncharacterized protein n=1 Tax=Toxocara canis TaxID=6265 RepID=A0A0B2VW22_TOXCA|nr:hypothetical protein Tcan_04259 [Toxocara canis]
MSLLVANLLLVFLCSTLSIAVITIIEGEIGQPLTLDLGNNVSVWARKLVGTTRTQYISRCSEVFKTNTNRSSCDSWSNNANKTGDDAIVTADGRLLIENLTNEDVGVYFSPEEKPHIFRTKTGYYVMPPNVIQVLTRSSKRTQTP